MHQPTKLINTSLRSTLRAAVTLRWAHKSDSGHKPQKAALGPQPTQLRTDRAPGTVPSGHSRSVHGAAAHLPEAAAPAAEDDISLAWLRTRSPGYGCEASNREQFPPRPLSNRILRITTPRPPLILRRGLVVTVARRRTISMSATVVDQAQIETADVGRVRSIEGPRRLLLARLDYIRSPPTLLKSSLPHSHVPSARKDDPTIPGGCKRPPPSPYSPCCAGLMVSLRRGINPRPGIGDGPLRCR